MSKRKSTKSAKKASSRDEPALTMRSKAVAASSTRSPKVEVVESSAATNDEDSGVADEPSYAIEDETSSVLAAHLGGDEVVDSAGSAPTSSVSTGRVSTGRVSTGRPSVKLGRPSVKLGCRKRVAAPESTTALSRSDPFQAYMREVQRYKLLTRDEELELTREYEKTGDPEIARHLVTANLRLVIKLAFEYRQAYKNMMDLVQEGNIGLMQAVKRFDPYRGVKLSSYSAWWIRAYMLRFILNNWRLVKLGTTQAQRKLFFNLNKQRAKLNAMGIEPTNEIIAERLGVKEKEVQEMALRMGSSEASLDAPAGDGEGRKVARVELMASADKSTEDTVAEQQLNKLVNQHLAIFRERLVDKELIIFDERMVALEPLTLQKLGTKFGVSRERVRQIEARLSRKLREYLKSEIGDAVAMGL